MGRGAVATMLVQRGTLHVGDAVVAGDAWGRVKALNDHNGKKVKDAGPGVPVEILGFDRPPPAGEICRVVENDRVARQTAQQRAQRKRTEMLAKRSKAVSLEDLFSQMQEGALKELALIIKADVQGSVEAAVDEISKIHHDEVSVQVIHSGVGGIVASDIMLAAASSAIVVGFNVRPNAEAKALADREGVDIRTYRVIYQLTEDIQRALIGMLSPERVEEVLGEVEVRQTFRASRVGTIAGCMVTQGTVQRGAQVRIVRDGTIVHDGRIGTLKRFQDDVREVAAGLRVRDHDRQLQRHQRGRRPRGLHRARGRPLRLSASGLAQYSLVSGNEYLTRSVNIRCLTPCRGRRPRAAHPPRHSPVCTRSVNTGHRPARA